MLWQCSRNIKAVEDYNSLHDSPSSITPPHRFNHSSSPSLVSPKPLPKPTFKSNTWNSTFQNTLWKHLLLPHYLLLLSLWLLDLWQCLLHMDGPSVPIHLSPPICHHPQEHHSLPGTLWLTLLLHWWHSHPACGPFLDLLNPSHPFH